MQEDEEKMSRDDGSRAYYTRSGIEAIDVINAFELDFCLGNVIKYVLRCGRKTPCRRSDLQKALWYLTLAVEKEINAPVESGE